MDQSNSDGQPPARPGILSRFVYDKLKEARQLREGVEAERPGKAEALIRKVRQKEEAWEASQLAAVAPTESERAAMAERKAICALFHRQRPVVSIFWTTLKKHPEELKRFMKPEGTRSEFNSFVKAFVSEHLPDIKADFELIANCWPVWNRFRKRPKRDLHSVALLSTAAKMGTSPERVREIVAMSTGPYPQH